MGGVPILSGCGFCCWRGVAIWAWGIWGFPGGGFLGGFGAGAAALGLDGVLVTLDAVSLAAACGAAGMPVPADVGCQPGGRTVPGLVRGGVWGSGGALPPGWGYGWAWGAWVLVGMPPGAWVGACAWARLWCGGLRCIGASAGGVQ